MFLNGIINSIMYCYNTISSAVFERRKKKCFIKEQNQKKQTTTKKTSRARHTLQFNCLPYENCESRQLFHQDISLIAVALYSKLF